MVQVITAKVFSDMVIVPHEQGGRGKLILIYGSFGTTRWSLLLLEKPLSSGRPVMVLDEGNSFDPYLITKMAQLSRHQPRCFLRQIRISRAFTCHQMVTLIRGAKEAAEKFNTRHILVTGLLSTFYDENVQEWEARRLFKGALQALSALVCSGMTVLAVCPDPPGFTRRAFLKTLRSRADHVVRIEGKGAPLIYVEKPPSNPGVRFGSEHDGQNSIIFSSANPEDRNRGLGLVP